MEKRRNHPTSLQSIRRENLRALAKSIGGVSQLAGRLDKSQSQMSHLIGQHPIKNIGDKIAAEVESAFNKPPGWLDHPHELVGKTFISSPIEQHDFGVLCQQVPLISWEEVAQWDTLAYHYQPTNETPMIVTTTFHLGPFAFALNVIGDHMESSTGISFPEGAVIIVEPDSIAAPNSFVIARIARDRGATLKQLVLKGSSRYLKPLNQRYPILEYTITTVILGVVKQLFFNFNMPKRHKTFRHAFSVSDKNHRECTTSSLLMTEDN